MKLATMVKETIMHYYPYKLRVCNKPDLKNDAADSFVRQPSQLRIVTANFFHIECETIQPDPTKLIKYTKFCTWHTRLLAIASLSLLKNLSTSCVNKAVGNIRSH